MMTLSIISFLVGAALAQRFKVMILMPAIVIFLGISFASGVANAQTAWWIALMAAAAAICLQIGYFVGMGVRQVLAAALSRRSPLTSPTTPARHAAR
jgi:hypothetical protein